jgi:hypothetical protein
MNDFGLPIFLEEVIKEMVTDVNKKVRDNILLGKAKLSKVIFIYFYPEYDCF